MTHFQFEFVGADQVIDAFDKFPDAIDAGVKRAAEALRQQAIGRTPLGRTGHLKRSWTGVEKRGGFSFGFGNVADYAGIVETGGYKSVGPRTVEHEGKIYSRQAVGGIILPMLEDVYLIESVARLMLGTIMKELTKNART